MQPPLILEIDMSFIIENLTLLFLICLVILNLFGFVQFGVDKAKAKRKQWRIPEQQLFTTALLGGSLGCILGMYVFRHKKKHKSFTIGMPVILLLQIAAAVAVPYLF